MAEYIGVTDARSLEEEGELKRAALLFERLAVPSASSVRWIAETTAHMPGAQLEHINRFVSLLDYLAECQVIVEPEVVSTIPGLEGLDDRTFYDRIMRPDNPVLRQFTADEASVIAAGAWARRVGEASERVCRRISEHLRRINGWDTVVVASGAEAAQRLLAPGEDAVARVLIAAMPQPVDSTPWEAILEFRCDPQARRHFSQLKSWINKAVKLQVASGELQDEIRELLYQYEEYLRTHTIATQKGPVETLVTISAEIAEAFLDLKPTKLANALFAIRRRSVALTEAERVAPGRELAYIASARHRFR